MASQQQTETSVFDAAKAIVEALKGLDKPSQTLAIRFASESLGVSGGSNAGAAGGTCAVVADVPARTSVGQRTRTDIKQFAPAAKAPEQRSTCLRPSPAYFLSLFEASESARKDTVDANTLKEAARLAGRRQAKNWAFTLTNAKNAGYLDSAGSGQYRGSTPWVRPWLRLRCLETIPQARQSGLPNGRQQRAAQGLRGTRNPVGDAMRIDPGARICQLLLKPSTRPSRRFRQRGSFPSPRSRRTKSPGWTPSRR